MPDDDTPTTDAQPLFGLGDSPASAEDDTDPQTESEGLWSSVTPAGGVGSILDSLNPFGDG